MSSAEATFGVRYLRADSVEARTELDRSEQRRAPFAAADAVIDRLIAHALRGERIAVVALPEGAAQECVQPLIRLNAGERDALARHFAVAVQEKRGSWHIPAEAPLPCGGHAARALGAPRRAARAQHG